MVDEGKVKFCFEFWLYFQATISVLRISDDKLRNRIFRTHIVLLKLYKPSESGDNQG